jgi:hypothetical protein
MQVTTSPTLNWCIAVSPKFDELPRPKALQRLRQKKGRNPPFRWHADWPDQSECRRSQGSSASKLSECLHPDRSCAADPRPRYSRRFRKARRGAMVHPSFGFWEQLFRQEKLISEASLLLDKFKAARQTITALHSGKRQRQINITAEPKCWPAVHRQPGSLPARVLIEKSVELTARISPRFPSKYNSNNPQRRTA